MKLNKRILHIRRGQNGRRPSCYPLDGAGMPMRVTNYIPVKELKDLSIESINKSKEVSDVVCLPEMMSLFDCLSKHEFDKNFCKEQSTILQNCYTNYVNRVKEIQRTKSKS